MTKRFAVGILKSEKGFLAERRRKDEDYFAGEVLFPGGHLDKNESPEEALVREIKEELDVDIKDYEFVGEFVHPDGAIDIVYLIHSWDGEPKAVEAEELLWIKREDELTVPLSRDMLRAVRAKA